MGDRYRPANHYAPPPSQPYTPSSYAPPSSDQYSSNPNGALTTRRPSDSDLYHPSHSSQSLTQQNSAYLDPSSQSRRRHRSRSRRHRSRDQDRSRSNDRSRSRSNSRVKEWGSAAVGAAAGGLLGKELGHGKLATLGGLVAGAYGAHELERRVEKHREKKRMEEPYGERKDRERERGGHRRRRSSGGLVDNIKEKVEGFLNQQQEGGEREREKRRSRSHAGTGGGRRGGRSEYDDSSDDERYERRSTKGSRRERDDYY